MKVVKLEKTNTSPAVISVSWFNSKGEPFGFFLQGDGETSMEELEQHMALQFFHVFSEIAQEFSA